MSSFNEDMCATAAKDLCLSKLEIKTFTCEWVISHFTFRGETPDRFVESSIFPADAANDGPKWSLRAYPAYLVNGACYLAIEIISHSNLNEDAKFKILILNEKRDICNSIEGTFIFREQNTKIFKDFASRSNLLNKSKGLLPQDALTLLFELIVAVKGSSIIIPAQSNIEQFEDQNHKLSQDFRALLDNKEFSDVTLAAGTHELKAHKSVLIARSKVFAAMFQHQTEERKLNRISITAIDHKVLEQMLCYMYTDEAPNLYTMADDLLAAADKYDLKNLKIMCEESLRTNISIENAAYTLMLADSHNGKHLKSKTIDFIIRNAPSVMKTQGWKEMRTAQPYLSEEAFCSIAESLKTN